MTDERPQPGMDGKVYHLVPEAEWKRKSSGALYSPEAFDQDGFIHCTIGVENLLAVGNMFYAEDHRPYLALEIDVNRVDAPVRFDDDTRVYPHIYGDLPTEAVVDVFVVVRSADGSFMELVRNP